MFIMYPDLSMVHSWNKLQGSEEVYKLNKSRRLNYILQNTLDHHHVYYVS